MSFVTSTKLGSIMLFVRSVDKALGFYSEALGLKTIHMASNFAELEDINK